MKTKILFFLVSVNLLLISGCLTKYIPKKYFETKHDLVVNVKPVPAAAFVEKNQSKSDSGALSLLVGTIVKSSRENEMRKIISLIDEEQIRKDLKQSVQKKLAKFYNVKKDSNDLMVDIKINQLSLTVPTGDFGIRLGSYMLEVHGLVTVFDLTENNKEIAYSYVSTKEIINDEMNTAEINRRITRAVDELSDIVAEFMWKSADE